MVEIAYVYIMSSSFQRLYIGVTTEIEVRVAQHKNSAYEDSHTSKYRIDRLVYLERFGSIVEAISREKQLKRWSRIKKIRIIVAENPTWQDLSADGASRLSFIRGSDWALGLAGRWNRQERNAGVSPFALLGRDDVWFQGARSR